MGRASRGPRRRREAREARLLHCAAEMVFPGNSDEQTPDPVTDRVADRVTDRVADPIADRAMRAGGDPVAASVAAAGADAGADVSPETGKGAWRDVASASSRLRGLLPRRGTDLVAAAPRRPFHALTIEEALRSLGASRAGLDDKEARARRKRFGPNEIEPIAERSSLSILLEQIANVPAGLLVGSTLVSGLLGETVDTAVLLSVLGLDTAIGYTLERRNESLLAAWQRLQAGDVDVLRGGRVRTLFATELVPGDVLLLRAGDVVAADARVISAHRLSCDEAALTGESEPQPKQPDPVPSGAPLAERACMLFTGTTVAGGRGRALVTATGPRTELARVRRLIERAAEPRTPLSRRLDQLGNRIAAIAVGGAAATGIIGLLRGRPLARVLRNAVALGIAALPEGLPVVSTAALVHSMNRMRGAGLYVRRLSSAETLGGVTVICADKTGTLTMNRMRVEVIAEGGRVHKLDDEPVDLARRGLAERAHRRAAGAGAADSRDLVDVEGLFDDRLALLLAAGLLNSDVDVHRRGTAAPGAKPDPRSARPGSARPESARPGSARPDRAKPDRGDAELDLSGSSTELALFAAAIRAGLDGAALREALPTERLTERRPGHPYVVSVHRFASRSGVGGDGDGGGGERRVAFVKGAPEQVLELCDRDYAGGPGSLDQAARARILDDNDRLASTGLRMLGIAWRPLPEGQMRARGLRPGSREGSSSRREGDGYAWLGMVGLRDPLREGAAETVRRAVGIRTLILTGDQRATAEAIGREVGLPGIAIEGAEAVELALRDDEEARAKLAKVSVIARVTPEQKLAVVEALRRSGEVVAMAGDGVNDAPALKAADVGIAVGRGASDLARRVADVVSDGDDLRSILAAVGEGRIVQDNLRRALRFLFATNASELALVLGAALALGRDPLTPLQLLWINLLTDTVPALALALEPGQPEVLDRPPAPPDAPLLTRSLQRQVGRDGLGMAALGYLGFAVGGPPLSFGVLSGAQLAYTFACRAPGAMTERFRRLAAITAGVHATALVSPLGGLLGLDGPARLVALAGFGGGAMAMRVASELTDGVVIEERGAAAAPAWDRSTLDWASARRRATRAREAAHKTAAAKKER